MQGSPGAERYLELMKGCLTRTLFVEEALAIVEPTSRSGRILKTALGRRNLYIARRPDAGDTDSRAAGRDWPPTADTMIGLARLENIHTCVRRALADGVPGDLIETGVWRGGATIFMRAVLAAYGITDRKVWVADSFEGLPKPDVDGYPEDAGDAHWTYPELAIGLEEVKRRFRSYGLLDDQVAFVVGWFKDTLRTIPASAFCVIRLDGDMYESTIDALNALYPRLSPGGFAIIDDFGCVPACEKAVTDYRSDHGISAPIEMVDWTGAWWRKPG